MELNNIYIQYSIYFVAGLLGLGAHFLKQKIRGQTAHAIRDWFINNIKDTILSVIFYIASFSALVHTDDISFYTAFMCGYCSDSLFSRKPKTNEKIPTNY
ncbi:MAG: hypothetical protein NZZ41_07945 [Candidatus Dojkabacteria bacterium]|nr:hypothetical protein [Candidatus Dojkabacteria bacterium]